MKCPECGAMNPPGATKCVNCGMPLPPAGAGGGMAPRGMPGGKPPMYARGTDPSRQTGAGSLGGRKAYARGTVPQRAGQTGEGGPGGRPPDTQGNETPSSQNDTDTNEKGPFYSKGSKPPLGSGKRFANLSDALKARGARNPKALAAYIGRKKYGKSRFQGLSARGR